MTTPRNENDNDKDYNVINSIINEILWLCIPYHRYLFEGLYVSYLPVKEQKDKEVIHEH